MTADQPAQSALPDPAPRGSALLRAVEVMEALRAPDGDAWTHRQTHASLARYLLEESHEVLEVIDAPQEHGPTALVDELGDLLFQILFHARIGQEQEPAWDVDDVARSFVAKMERRNPHIFGEDREGALRDRDDVEEIIAQWHAVKAAERKASGAPEKGWFDGIPAGLPSLQAAAKAVHRARSAGRLDELLESADDASTAMTAEDAAASEGAPDPAPGGITGADRGADVGRALLDLVVAAESRDVDPESALRALLARMRTTPGATPQEPEPSDVPGDCT